MYLDVDVLLALIKEKDFNKIYANKINSIKEEKYTSVMSLVELEIVIKREISNILSMEIDMLILKIIPDLKIVDCNKKIFEDSLKLRIKYGMGIFDSIHAATSLNFDKRIASTDNVYSKIKNLTVIS